MIFLLEGMFLLGEISIVEIDKVKGFKMVLGLNRFVFLLCVGRMSLFLEKDCFIWKGGVVKRIWNRSMCNVGEG